MRSRILREGSGHGFEGGNGNENGNRNLDDLICNGKTYARVRVEQESSKEGKFSSA